MAVTIKENTSESELIKVGNPFHNDRFVRTEYYVEVSFRIDGLPILQTVKIDTGSPYTIIGLDGKDIKRFKDRIKTCKTDIEAFDAQENQLDIEKYTVENFSLTEDVCFDSITCLFSEKLKERAILGMDILSLFELTYKFDSGKQSSGTFRIVNLPKAASSINSQIEKRAPEDEILMFTLFSIDT